MEEKYKIKLENNGGKHFVDIQVNDCTDDFHINFLDFKDEDISLDKISQFDLRAPRNLIRKNIKDSVYKEIFQRRKIRAKINDIYGCFYPNDNGVFVWKEESVQKGLPLVDGIVIERLDDKSARVKILLNYSNTSVQVNKDSSSSRLKKFIIWEGVYSIHQKLNISALLNSIDLFEEYEIPTKLMDGLNEVKVLNQISQYKKSEEVKTPSGQTSAQTHVVKGTEPESSPIGNDESNRIEQINKLKAKLKSESDKLKKLEEENVRLYSQKATLEKDKEELNNRIKKYIGDQTKFTDAIEREKNFNRIITELKPYQEFYAQYAEGIRIEEIKLDFDELSRHRRYIENFSKSSDFQKDQRITETFEAFTELNRILIFEVEANDRILDKIASYEPQFNSSLGEFRNLLNQVNQSIIDSCKHTEDFSLKMIPAQIMEVLAHPNNYLIIEKFNHSFLDLNIRFNEFTEAGWNTLLRVLENLRKLVYIKSVI
ncbi:hypothetical protein MASR2M39_12230 [Ignavibacteriales bacterium]